MRTFLMIMLAALSLGAFDATVRDAQAHPHAAKNRSTETSAVDWRRERGIHARKATSKREAQRERRWWTHDRRPAEREQAAKTKRYAHAKRHTKSRSYSYQDRQLRDRRYAYKKRRANERRYAYKKRYSRKLRVAMRSRSKHWERIAKATAAPRKRQVAAVPALPEKRRIASVPALPVKRQMTAAAKQSEVAKEPQAQAKASAKLPKIARGNPVRIPVKPYKIVKRDSGSVLKGVASYYWDPQPVASGGRYNPQALTAAHRTLPFGTRVKVTNLHNGRSVVVKINDRGPYIRGRNIDLSLRAATVIGMRKSGVVPVSMEIL